MSVCLQVFKNGNYLSALRQLMALFCSQTFYFEKTCILLESPFRAELNGLYPNWTSLMHKSGFPHYVRFLQIESQMHGQSISIPLLVWFLTLAVCCS